MAPWRRWWALLVLLLVYTVNQAQRFLFGVAASPMAAALHFKGGSSGIAFQALVGPVFGVCFAVFALVMAPLGDKYHRVGLLTAATGVWSAATFGVAYGNAYWHVALLRVVQAVAQSMCTPLANSLIADMFLPKERGKAVGIFSMGIYVGYGLSFAGNAYLDDHSWRGLFRVFGLPGFAAAVLAVTVREPPRRKQRHPKSLRQSTHAQSGTGTTWGGPGGVATALPALADDEATTSPLLASYAQSQAQPQAQLHPQPGRGMRVFSADDALALEGAVGSSAGRNDDPHRTFSFEIEPPAHAAAHGGAAGGGVDRGGDRRGGGRSRLLSFNVTLDAPLLPTPLLSPSTTTSSARARTGDELVPPAAQSTMQRGAINGTNGCEGERLLNALDDGDDADGTAGDDAGPASFVQAMKVMLASPPLLMLLVASGIRNGAGLVWAYNTNVFFETAQHQTRNQIAAFMSWVPAVAGSCGAVLGGWLSDALLKRSGVSARFGVLVVSQFLAAPMTLAVLYTPCPYAYLVLIAANVVGESWIGVAITLVVDVVPHRIVGTSVAFYYFSITLIASFMPLLVPSLKAVWSLRGALVVLYPCMYLVSGVLFLVTAKMFGGVHVQKAGRSIG